MAINLAMSFVDYPWRYAHVPPGRDRAAPVPEHRARRAAGHGRVGTDGPGGSQRPARGEAGLRLARAARGSLRRPEERRPRPAAGQRRHGVVSRLLPAADRAAHPVRRVREPALAGGRLALRSGDRAGRAGPRRSNATCGSGGRLLVAGTAPPPLPIGTDRRPAPTQGYWRIHDRSGAAVAEGHRPASSSTASTSRSRRSQRRSSR